MLPTGVYTNCWMKNSVCSTVYSARAMKCWVRLKSGVDFEKRIAAIYQKCRTLEQIQFEFDQLQKEMDAEIAAGRAGCHEKLLNNFDQEVVEKVRIQSHDYSDQFNQRLWLVISFLLNDYAHFSEDEFSFTLHRNPFAGENIHPGPYRMGKNVNEVNTYRVGHPLAQRVLEQAGKIETPTGELTFECTDSGKHIASLDPLRETRLADLLAIYNSRTRNRRHFTFDRLHGGWRASG